MLKWKKKDISSSLLSGKTKRLQKFRQNLEPAALGGASWSMSKFFFLCNPPLVSAFSCKPCQWDESQTARGLIFSGIKMTPVENERTSKHYLQPACELSHESKTHHKNWSRRTLDPLVTPATLWLGQREQEKSQGCPLPTSHQDTNLELQMLLYRLLAETKCFYFCGSKQQNKRSYATPFLSLRDFCSPGIPSHKAANTFFPDL